MKKITIILTCAMLLLAYSCSSDDESEKSNPLVGTWIGEKKISGWENNHKIVFNKDGTGTWGKWWDTGSYDDPFKYTYTSDVITFDFFDGSPEKWHYKVSGNILYLGGKNAEGKYTEGKSGDEKVFKLLKQ